MALVAGSAVIVRSCPLPYPVAHRSARNDGLVAYNLAIMWVLVRLSDPVACYEWLGMGTGLTRKTFTFL